MNMSNGMKSFFAEMEKSGDPSTTNFIETLSSIEPDWPLIGFITLKALMGAIQDTGKKASRMDVFSMSLLLSIQNGAETPFLIWTRAIAHVENSMKLLDKLQEVAKEANDAGSKSA